MTKQLLALFAISTILCGISLSPASAHRGGDIIVWGGMGGFGMPSVISSGGKKRGSIVLLGRRKRSADVVQPQVTLYKLLPAVQL